jgi:hypothetical protein
MIIELVNVQSLSTGGHVKTSAEADKESLCAKWFDIDTVLDKTFAIRCVVRLHLTKLSGLGRFQVEGRAPTYSSGTCHVSEEYRITGRPLPHDHSTNHWSFTRHVCTLSHCRPKTGVSSTVTIFLLI